MESPDLRVFQAVAREGSITKAAVRLGYVQSNVTARIQQLEAELQTVLFYRHNRGMTLTPSGAQLLGYADKIVGLLDEASKAMAVSSEPRGPLQLGSTQTAAAVRLPSLLAAYNKRHPNVVLSLATGHSELMMEKVLHYELEGAFVTYHREHPELQVLQAFDEELAIAAAPAIASIEEAVSRPILVLPAGCTCRNVLEQYLQSRGLRAGLTMEFGTLEAILGGVSAGLGISLLPRAVLSQAEAEGRIRIHAIPEPFSRAQTVFITRKDIFVSSALLAFQETLQQGWATVNR